MALAFAYKPESLLLSYEFMTLKAKIGALTKMKLSKYQLKLCYSAESNTTFLLPNGLKNTFRRSLV